MVEENQLEEVAPDMLEFRDMVESVIKSKREKYHEYIVILIGQNFNTSFNPALDDIIYDKIRNRFL